PCAANSVTPVERTLLIQRYAEGYDALVAALAEAEDVMEVAPPGEWTPRQIAHHVADAAVIQSARLRILLAEDDPYIPGFDELGFADRLQYDRSIVSSLVLLHAMQDANLELLDGLSEDDWLRAGRHEEYGHFSVEDWLERAADHPHDHAAQIQALLNDHG
ncbi:MAG TPA: DinB family protein, partial [Dehalococcoidia bacterium]|nr:DinB family protein [Dehalococcoidia bacterium]